MAIFVESTLTEVALGLITLIFIFWLILTHIFSYWKNRGVPYVEPHLIFGNLKDVAFAKRSMFDIQNDLYKQLEGERMGGYYQFFKPVLLIRDPELIERILIKDFSHFMDRGFGNVDPEHEPLTTGLSILSGQPWRNLRYKLTPTFTTGKLKGMFEQICNCGESLLQELREYSQKEEVIEPRSVLNLFTTDIIATCAFGLQFSRESEEGKLFRDMATKVFTPSRVQMLRFFISMTSLKLAKILGIPLFPMDVSKYFIEVTKATIKYREDNNIQRNDFLQLLLTIRDQEKSGKFTDVNQELKEEDAYLKQEDYKSTNDTENLELTDEVIAAQAFLFLTAGSETISSSTALALYFIAANPTVQRKVQEEVDSTLAKHGHWTYDALKDMTYIDQVIQEGLRILPFTPTLQRVCTIPYKMPGTDFKIEKGQLVMIPVFPLHMDPKYYPNPETFDPERFRGNNYRPSNKYLPFGDGPRMCIAMRFALLEMKVCLAKVMSQFSVSVNSKTVQPLQFDPVSFMPLPKGGVWLNVKERPTRILS